MMGALSTVFICIAVVFLTAIPLRRLIYGLDPAARIGISGLLGLGILGTVTFFVGVFALHLWIPLAIFALACLAFYRRGAITMSWFRFSAPRNWELLLPLTIGLVFAMCLAGVFAPSTSADWDSIAYHLAVPKLWLDSGRINVIPFIHQSNFPFAVDSLFFYPLQMGSQSGAKLFIWFFTLFGSITLFGLARQKFGTLAGWLSAGIFITIPAVVWQSGTAYIDVAHGLYAGLGIAFACWWLEEEDSRLAILSALMLGLAAGTKYTGLQTIAVVGLVTLVGAIIWKRNVKWALGIGILALAIASPWYVKNAIWKENPVFPFFYSKLGGKDWDQRRADIYANEQNTFGVGREAPPQGSLKLHRVGHSVLGLAYQPGRYVNPMQTQGMGDPMGAMGIVLVGALALALSCRPRGRFERSMTISVLGSLAIWFVLTQQSRYILGLAPPLILLAAQVSTRRGFKVLVVFIAVMQGLVTLYLYRTLPGGFSDQFPVAVGREPTETFLRREVAFYTPAQSINRLGNQAKVALYDEVFGYFLNVPYEWANPGHSTLIPYDGMANGVDYAREMRRLGFTHVYMNFAPLVKDPAVAAEMTAAFQGVPFPDERARQFQDSWESKFNWLVVDSVQKGVLEVVEVFGNPARPRGFLLKFRDSDQSAKT